MEDKAEMTREELIALGWIKKPSDKMQEKAEKQLTPVEWLESEFNKWSEGGLFIPPHIITQAKEMDKEKLKDAYDAGVWDVGCRAVNFDEYYKRTFKSE